MIQQNISGRLTDTARTRDRYLIRGVPSTAVKHGHSALTVLRDAMTGHPCYPPAWTTTRRHPTDHNRRE
jgi:hypothetical protein